MKGKVIKRYKDYPPEEIERRRAYQRKYYEDHKEQAKEYQRRYNLAHKKMRNRRGGSYKPKMAERQAVKECFNSGDIQHMPVEKSLKAIEQILNYERWFTM